VQGTGFEQSGVFQGRESAFDIFPTGVLGEDCADADFERGFAGPPVLMAEPGAHEIVRLAQGSAAAADS
jgi:hypothetical protein